LEEEMHQREVGVSLFRNNIEREGISGKDVSVSICRGFAEAEYSIGGVKFVCNFYAGNEERARLYLKL